MTGISDRNEFDNLINTFIDKRLNGSTVGEANEAININNYND